VSDKRKNRIPQDIVELLLAQDGLCFYCGDPLPLTDHIYHLAITRDHVCPKDNGGRNSRNIVLCHRMCNEHKAHSLPTAKQIGLCWSLYEIVKARKEQVRLMFAKYKYLGRKGVLKYNK